MGKPTFLEGDLRMSVVLVGNIFRKSMTKFNFVKRYEEIGAGTGGIASIPP